MLPEGDSVSAYRDGVPEIAEIIGKLDCNFPQVSAWQPHAHRLEDRTRQAFRFLLADNQMFTDATQKLLAIEDLCRSFAVPGAWSQQSADVSR
jgi:hypothetical protein